MQTIPYIRFTNNIIAYKIICIIMIHIDADTKRSQLAQINSRQDEKKRWKILAEDLGVKEIENISSLHDIKRHIGKTMQRDNIPRNSELLDMLSIDKRKQHLQLLKIKPTKSASGITVISVMTKPYNCPHGVCIFCPGGEKVGTPQSYLPTEPATMRALEAEYEPDRQIESRFNQLKKIFFF